MLSGLVQVADQGGGLRPRKWSGGQGEEGEGEESQKEEKEREEEEEQKV